MVLDMSLGDDLVVTDIIQEAIQELDMLMSTERTQLIGEPEFGLSMESFLWELEPSVSQIRDHVASTITANTTWMKLLSYDINVSVAPGTEHGIYTITITINGVSDAYAKQENDEASLHPITKEYVYR